MIIAFYAICLYFWYKSLHAWSVISPVATKNIFGCLENIPFPSQPTVAELNKEIEYVGKITPIAYELLCPKTNESRANTVSSGVEENNSNQA